MNELKIFENKEFGAIRTIEIENKPYFVGKDVAEILGYSNSRDALAKRVDDEDKGVANCDTLGGKQELTIVNESGLYSLIISSKLPAAKKFKHWVTSEVLPSIRKHGIYAIDEIIANPDIGIAALTALKEEREKSKVLEKAVAIQKQQITEMKPKANYVDIILDNKGLVAITRIAKDYGMSGQAMNILLNKHGIQYKQSGQWLLCSKYHSMGYTHSKTFDIKHSDGTPDVVMETQWTQKGRLFLYEKLRANGILPIIERRAN